MAFISLLSNFENILWYSAIVLAGFGGLFIILSIFFNVEHFTSALHLGDHDIGDHDIGDHDIGDHDIGDHDIGDHDIGDHDIGDHDIGDHDIGDHETSEPLKSIDDGVTQNTTRTKAPLFLRLSSFTLTFGVLGITTLKYADYNFAWRISRIIIIFAAPFLITYIVSKIWQRISATTSLPVARGRELIGMVGTVAIPVDNRGGTIEVYLGKEIGYSKMFAKSFSYYDRFEKGEKVRIVAMKEGFYLVDR